MKNIFTLTTIFLSLWSISSIAQYNRVPSHYMDNWIYTKDTTIGNLTYPSYNEPGPSDFWTTSNPACHTVANMEPSVYKTRDANFGTYAALLRAVKLWGNSIAAGSILTGEYKGGTDPSKAIFIGKPWGGGRPERFMGNYKYIPVDGDSCRGYVFLYKNTSGTRDTIGYAEFDRTMEGTTVKQYKQFDITIDYKSTATPDSIAIVFTTSKDGANLNGGLGTELYLDRVQLLYAGETSVNYSSREESYFWVYPNPATDYINVGINQYFAGNATMKIYNIYGQMVKEVELALTNNTIQIEDLSRGHYTFVIEELSSPISKGKFIKQ